MRSPANRIAQHFARLVASFPDPKDILVAYLRTPLRGVSFRNAVRQLAKGGLGRSRRVGFVATSEIVSRANRLLLWLEGREPGIRDPYEVLGLSRSATAEEILHRYRTLSKQVHPDRHPPGRQKYWTARQEEVNRAHQILTDPIHRARWREGVAERNALLRRLAVIERSSSG